MTKFTKASSGQTIIETVVAIFVLTTGLASGLALAIVAFSATSEISDKLTATGLAREGIEITRRMRDSNWLVAKAAGKLATCLDLDPNGGQLCYSTWLTERYNITGQTGEGSTYRAFFAPTSMANKWTLSLSTDPLADNFFRLYAQSGGALSHSATSAPSKFFRKIQMIYALTSAPYSATSPLVLARVSVWWWGKRCPQITYLNSPQDTTCKLITEEYISNWRNY